MNDLPSFVIRKKDIGYSIQVNGKEIANLVSCVTAKISGTDMLTVCLEIPASSFETYCDINVETEKS